MAKKRAKRGRSPNLGTDQTYEIHFFVPRLGFRAGFYSAESKEQALHRFKQEHPSGQAFWIAPARGKAIAGPQAMQYLVWWKNYGGPDWEPSMLFVVNPEGIPVGSIPDTGTQLKFHWDVAMRRQASSSPDHRFEFVDEPTASLIGNEISVQADRFRKARFDEWESGKFDQIEPEQGPELGGLEEIEFPPERPRPEMWTLEDVIQAVKDGYRFGLPFVMGESLFSPNAYWIGGQQYAALLLAMSQEHAPDLEMLEDGWMRVKLYFQPQMVPERTWIGRPNQNGVVAVFAEIDPSTVDWAVLNRPS